MKSKESLKTEPWASPDQPCYFYGNFDMYEKPNANA